MIEAIDAIIRKNRDKPIEGGSNKAYQIQGEFGGKIYILGLNKGRVGQFYPL